MGSSKHIDFYIYKENSDYLYLPRIHKPDKKSLFSTYLFYLINKLQKKNIKIKSKIVRSIINKLVQLYLKKGKRDSWKFRKKYLNYLKKKKVSFTNFSLDVNIPIMEKAYLRARYGVDWMMPPKSNWHKRLTLK